jgi:hypothetical protein
MIQPTLTRDPDSGYWRAKRGPVVAWGKTRQKAMAKLARVERYIESVEQPKGERA